MTFGSITTPAPQVAVNYYVAIGQLSARASGGEEISAGLTAPSFFAPIVPYTPFVLVGLLFVIAFGILIINKFKNLKNIGAALILAVMVASTPLVLPYITQGSRQTAKAGPDEVPRNIRVVPFESNQVRITWATDAPQYGTVRFARAPLAENSVRVLVADNQQKTTDHSVVVDKLSQGVMYEFEILSGTTWYNNNGTPIQFTY